MKRLWLAILLVLGGLFAGTTLAQGVTLHFACDSVGVGLDLCKQETQAWAQQTGNNVVLVSVPTSSTDRLGLFQQQLAAQSDSVDVYMIDVIWPGLLGSYFVDLSQYFSADQINAFNPALVKNDQFDGKQVAIPWFNDAGLLYYRKDLLQKYGYDGPPTTWSELTSMAQKIQAGERAAGNDKFWGYVWQGNSYEGLTCDALEWVYSYGGGTIVDSNGNITINNDKAAQAINMAKSWVGTISPPGVTGYQEEDARGVFQAGNAAFMRNWPYAYASGNSADSPIKGKFDVAPLPKADTSDGVHTGTLGGWQLAVSRFSKHPKEAADLIRYLTSADVETARAVSAGSYLPSRLPLFDAPQVMQQQAWMHNLKPLFENAVARPSSATKQKYAQVSAAFWTAVHNVLTGQAQASSALAGLQQQLTRIKGAGW